MWLVEIIDVDVSSIHYAIVDKIVEYPVCFNISNRFSYTTAEQGFLFFGFFGFF